MFEGLLAIIEAWLTRELSCRRWEDHSYRTAAYRETITDMHSLDNCIDLRDLRDVYHLLEQVVDRINTRDAENS
jgi:hypothetical protein